MISSRPKPFALMARWFCLLLLLPACSGPLRADEPQRWLLVLDTSSTMKRCLPATGVAVQQFLAAAANGQIHKGDEVGVWSYGKQLSGQFKSYNWEPESSRQITTDLLAYVKQLRYSGDSSLSALSSTITRIVAGSERLTVVLFCDGQSQINFTPYDDGINQSFRDALDERKASRQPFVVVLRTQQGKFVGCTMNFPPANLNLPDFPPLPAPPKTNSPPAVVVKPAPKVVVPPLVIVGEEVGTNLNAVSKPPAPPPVPAPVVPTNPPAPATNRAVAAKQPEPLPTNTVVVPVVSNVLPPPATNQPPAMAVTQAVMPAVPPPAVNHVASPADTKNGERQTGVLVIIGAGLFLLAVVLAGFLIRSGRRPRSSLITSSMQEPPPRK